MNINSVDSSVRCGHASEDGAEKGGMKRTREGGESSTSKKRRVDEPGEVPGNIFECLPEDVINHLMQFLPFKDVLTLRALSDRIVKRVDPLLEPMWKEFSKREKIDFDWSFLEKEPYPEKERYLIGKSLVRYIELKEKVVVMTGVLPGERIQKLYTPFEPWMIRYPLLSAYIWKDIVYLACNDTETISKYKERFEIAGTNLKSSSSRISGDLLLKGLYHSVEYFSGTFDSDRQEILHHALSSLKCSIQQGATRASYLVIRSFNYWHNPLPYQFCYDLARGSADHKNTDYSGLELFLDQFQLNFKDIKQMYDAGIQDPPILAKLVKYLGERAHERVFDPRMADFARRAISGYRKAGQPITLQLLFVAAKDKMWNGKYQEALELYEEIIKNYYSDNKVPREILEGMAGARMKLKDWLKAAECYETLINHYFQNREVPPAQIFERASLARSNLGDTAKAEEHNRSYLAALMVPSAIAWGMSEPS